MRRGTTPTIQLTVSNEDGAFKAKRNVSGTWVWKELAFVDDSDAA